MKKTLRILAFSLFSIAGLTVVSCDNESYDPIIEGEKGVGKPVVTVNNQGDMIMLREGVVASKDRDGKITIEIVGADKSGKDVLTLNTFKLQRGTFPTNATANECNYYSVENKLLYTTIDKDRPNVISGMLTISEINRKARVLSGNFDIKRMMPTNNDNPNLKAFAISGSFKDINIVRSYATYLEAFADNEEMENLRETARIEGNRIIITSLDHVEKTQELILDLPSEGLVVTGSDPKEFKKLGWFKVAYTSKYGVKYTSDEVAESEGSLRIDEADYKDGKLISLKGRFEANLIGVGEENKDKKVKITFGEFSIKLDAPVDK
ncbi:DUF6252 family protein [Myroides sp. N17-2]|uniref:DUF6252 family protein n=1 Tax=Myroides sp. N17-2 TaxID=2030799 RepID=UPI000EFB15FE|nr:DUF6252 family protein [Myroides sp. N17-2]